MPTFLASLADLADGELCFATDNQNFYVKYGGNLVSIVGAAAGVDSINGESGVVVLDYTDVGAASAAQGTLADSALQPGANVSELNNDAGYITSAQAPGTDLSYDSATRVVSSSTGSDATITEAVCLW